MSRHVNLTLGQGIIDMETDARPGRENRLDQVHNSIEIYHDFFSLLRSAFFTIKCICVFCSTANTQICSKHTPDCAAHLLLTEQVEGEQLF